MDSALTVIIPTKGRHSLPKAEASVEAQTIPTVLHVEPDPERTGCGATLNRALAFIRTPWVATMGDDDELDPTYHETFLRQRVEDLDMVILAMRYQNGVVLPRKTDPSRLERGDVGATYVVRTELVRELGGWLPGHGEEDWDMIYRARDHGARIKIVPTVVYYVHGRVG